MALFLALLILAAFSLRLLYVHHRTVLADWDSAVYLMLADNLANGHGYREWPGAPPHTWFQPLYSILIAICKTINGNLELSGYLVSAFFGSLVILPIFAIARLMYSLRSACLASIIAMFNYRMVDASSLIITEMPYTFFWLGGVYFALRALGQPNGPLRDPILFGSTLGIAALIRTEGLFYFILLLAAWIISALVRRLQLRAVAIRLLLAVGAFAVLFVPYLWFLYDSLGHFTVTGRTARAVFVLMNAPRETYEFHAVDPFRYVLTNPGASMARILHNLEYIVRAHAVWAFPPVLIALMSLSFFGRPWPAGRFWQEACLVAIFVFPWVTLFGITGALTRYYFPFVALALVWVGHGVDTLPSWFEASFGKRLGPWARAPLRYWTVASVGVTVVFLSSAQQLMWPLRLHHFPVHAQQAKDQHIGIWLREHSAVSSPGIMAASPRIAYYAGGRYFGENDQELSEPALKDYLAKNRIDYVIADNFFVHQWYPKLAFLADQTQAPSYLQLVQKVSYSYEDGQDGYANIYFFDRSRPNN